MASMHSKENEVVNKHKKNNRKRRSIRLAPRYENISISSIPSTQITTTNNISIDEDIDNLTNIFQTTTSRCFILKSFSDANFHKSLKYGIWSSTYAHNAMLSEIYQSELTSIRPILFFFSVCGSRHFNAIGRMISNVQTNMRFQLWEKAKYDGYFQIAWLIVKDVPNYIFTDIKMSNSPVGMRKLITSCRDCDEVPYDEARQFLIKYCEYVKNTTCTSAWDDLEYFNTKQKEMEIQRGLHFEMEPALNNLLVPIDS